MDNATTPHVLDLTGSNIQDEIRRIRAQGPVTRVQVTDGVYAWSVTDTVLNRKILSGTEVSKDPQNWPAFRDEEIGEDFPLINWVNTRSMFTAGGDEHARLRRAIAPAFTHRRTAALEPRIRTIATELAERLESTPADQPVDLVQAFARPLPLQVINELLGVPEDMKHALCKGVDGIFAVGATEEARTASYADLTRLLRALINHLRANRGEDLTSALIAKVQDPEQDFSDLDLFGTLYLIINAGYETTANLIDQTIYLLLTHREYLAAALDGSLEWPEVIEETLRFESPAAHVPMRYALDDFTLGDEKISKGELILVNFAAAGRDPKIHGDTADVFDPTRREKTHLAFGFGVHHCLGASLARLEAQLAVPEILQRFPTMKLAVSADELGSVPGPVANGHARLPVFLRGR